MRPVILLLQPFPQNIVNIVVSQSFLEALFSRRIDPLADEDG